MDMVDRILIKGRCEENAKTHRCVCEAEWIGEKCENKKCDLNCVNSG